MNRLTAHRLLTDNHELAEEAGAPSVHSRVTSAEGTAGRLAAIHGGIRRVLGEIALIGSDVQLTFSECGWSKPLSASLSLPARAIESQHRVRKGCP